MNTLEIKNHESKKRMIKLYKGDCLIESDKIESGSVDLILTDLPYGVMQPNHTGVAYNKMYKNKLKWDYAIEPKKVFDIANRILRKNGKIILFSQGHYTTKLITETEPNIPFNYRATWEKDNFANALCCNKNMVSFTEDILIFSKSSEALPLDMTWGKHPIKDYSEILIAFIGLSKSQIYEKVGLGSFRFLRGCDKGNFTKPTKEVYCKLIELFNINEMNGFITFDDLSKIDSSFKKNKETERLEYLKKHNEKYPSTFNLWEGKKYKSNILKYKKDYDGHHPTQKPVLLLEDLIKTFSNEGDLVVDLTMGSGSTGVACKNTNRNFIGIEKDEKYFKIAQQRINWNLF